MRPIIEQLLVAHARRLDAQDLMGGRQPPPQGRRALRLALMATAAPLLLLLAAVGAAAWLLLTHLQAARCRSLRLHRARNAAAAEAARRAEAELTDGARALPEELQAALRDEKLLCSITLQLMHEPVRACDGHVYERTAIEEWLSKRGVSPFTGERLDSCELQPSEEHRRLVRMLHRWEPALAYGAPTRRHTRASSSERPLAAEDARSWSLELHGVPALSAIFAALLRLTCGSSAVRLALWCLEAEGVAADPRVRALAADLAWHRVPTLAELESDEPSHLLRRAMLPRVGWRGLAPPRSAA